LPTGRQALSKAKALPYKEQGRELKKFMNRTGVLPVRKRRTIMFRLMKWVIILGLFVSIYLFYPNILRTIGNYLIISDPLEKSDAILVLSGDTTKGERVAEAVKLFKKGYGKYLVLSGNKIAWDTYAVEPMKKEATSLRIPEHSIITIKSEAHSTIEEAKIILGVFKERHFKSMILVTSSYHTRRAKWIFLKVFNGSSIKISACPANNVEYDADRWWQKRESAKSLFYEYTKLIWYKAVERFNADKPLKDKPVETSSKQILHLAFG